MTSEYRKYRKELAYLKHLKVEAKPAGRIHPKGCFYCSGPHATYQCLDKAAIIKYWAFESEEGEEEYPLDLGDA